MTISITGSTFSSFAAEGASAWTIATPAVPIGTTGLIAIFATEQNSSSPPAISTLTSLYPWFQVQTFSAVLSNGVAYQIEVWICVFLPLQQAVAQGSTNVTVQYGAPFDAACGVIFGVTGFPGDSMNFDRGTVSGSSFFTGNNNSTQELLNWSTVTANTLNISVVVQDSGTGSGGPEGFTALQGGHVWPTNYLGLGVAYQNSTSVLNSEQFSWLATGVPTMCMEFSLTDGSNLNGLPPAQAYEVITSYNYSVVNTSLISPIIGA
jgi:hypothetical protein